MQPPCGRGQWPERTWHGPLTAAAPSTHPRPPGQDRRSSAVHPGLCWCTPGALWCPHADGQQHSAGAPLGLYGAQMQTASSTGARLTPGSSSPFTRLLSQPTPAAVACQASFFSQQSHKWGLESTGVHSSLNHSLPAKVLTDVHLA